jgi:hypothetical protein
MFHPVSPLSGRCKSSGPSLLRSALAYNALGLTHANSVHWSAEIHPHAAAVTYPDLARAQTGKNANSRRRTANTTHSNTGHHTNAYRTNSDRRAASDPGIADRRGWPTDDGFRGYYKTALRGGPDIAIPQQSGDNQTKTEHVAEFVCH